MNLWGIEVLTHLKNKLVLTILQFPKFFNSNYILKFFDFSYKYITFMITTKKGAWEVSGGVWVVSGGCLVGISGFG